MTLDTALTMVACGLFGCACTLFLIEFGKWRLTRKKHENSCDKLLNESCSQWIVGFQSGATKTVKADTPESIVRMIASALGSDGGIQVHVAKIDAQETSDLAPQDTYTSLVNDPTTQIFSIAKHGTTISYEIRKNPQPGHPQQSLTIN